MGLTNMAFFSFTFEPVLYASNAVQKLWLEERESEVVYDDTCRRANGIGIFLFTVGSIVGPASIALSYVRATAQK